MNFTKISFPAFGIEIDPIRSFSVGPLNIHLYGVIIAVGLILAVVYAMSRRKQFGLTEDDLIDGVLMIVPVSIIFARAYYCIFQWEQYAENPLSVFYVWEGGLAIYGGVIGAALGIIAYCYFKKLKIAAVLDITALGFLIGQAIGRWGNFFNREAFGAATDSFMRMGLYNTQTRSYTYYHPTFLYESLWNTAGFVLLHFLSKKRRYDGQIALGYVAWYGLGRALIEGLRMDSLYIGTFRVSQLLAAISCLVALGILIYMSMRRHDPADLFVNQRSARELEEAEVTEEETETEPGEEA